ncbi:MAG: hypothetical protein K2N30_04480 [Clostridia bacterium]|nr:hypothetical protein [Clostridia bacterium]
MEFDIINLTPEELNRLTSVQMQVLRTAQKKKNELKENLEEDIKLFARLTLTNGTEASSLAEQKREELEAEFERECEKLAEQLNYSLSLSEPYPEPGEGDGEAGYIVDYSLSYNERYKIVRNFYLAIEDPSERMALYSADATAKKYLGSYYSSLYNVLYSYST